MAAAKGKAVPAVKPVDVNCAALRPGAYVTMTLTTGDTITGFVHSADPLMQIIMVRVPLVHTTLASELRMVKSNFIASYTVHPEKSEEPISMTSTTTKILQIREQKALRRTADLMSELNPDAPAHGQMMFDAVNKTLPCHWEQNNIIVLNQVRISEPYSSNDCVSLDGDQEALSRIKKVLEGETRRMEKKAALAAASPASSPSPSPTAAGAAPKLNPNIASFALPGVQPPPAAP